MNAPGLTDRQRESRRLTSIRNDLHAVEPGEWLVTADGGDGVLLEARGPSEERGTICRFHRDATVEERAFIADAPSNIRFLLRLLDRAIADKRQQLGQPGAQPQPEQPGRDDPKNYAAEAAMRCGEPAFAVFLEEKHGLERPLTTDRVAQKLRSLLGVTSRRDLNDNAAAATRWKALRGDFENWKRTGR